MWIKTCAWVRARLPLLAGGDSLGLDRWMVDRHLLRCEDCRRRLEALGASQEALRSASVEEPVPGAPSPSLWPDLAHRIRQARRPRPRTAWGFESRWAWVWPVTGLAAGLIVALSIVGLGARSDPRIGRIVDDYVRLDLPPLLKPENPERFRDHRRSRPPDHAAAYREAHAMAGPDEPGRRDDDDRFERDDRTR